MNICCVSQIIIHVGDVNDNEPVCTQRTQKIFVNGELTAVEARLGSPEPLATVTATDRDLLDSGKLTYAIVSGNARQTFEINQMSGAVNFAALLPRELNSFPLTIDASDTADQVVSCTLNILIFRNNNLVSIPINNQLLQHFDRAAFENVMSMVLSYFFGRPFAGHIYRTDSIQPGEDEPPM